MVYRELSDPSVYGLFFSVHYSYTVAVRRDVSSGWGLSHFGSASPTSGFTVSDVPLAEQRDHFASLRAVREWCSYFSSKVMPSGVPSVGPRVIIVNIQDSYRALPAGLLHVISEHTDRFIVVLGRVTGSPVSSSLIAKVHFRGSPHTVTFTTSSVLLDNFTVL